MTDSPKPEEPDYEPAGDGADPDRQPRAARIQGSIAPISSVQRAFADLHSQVAAARLISTQLQNPAITVALRSTEAFANVGAAFNAFANIGAASNTFSGVGSAASAIGDANWAWQTSTVLTQLPNYQRILGNLIPKIAFPDFAELFRQHQPANWHDATGDDVATLDLIDLARAGWPTAWVPGPKVLRALVLAAPAERGQVLCDHEDQVLDDCDTVLAEVVGGPSAVQAELLRQAVAAARQGCHAPAQALAASVIDTVIRESVSPWRGYNEWLRLHPDDDDFTIGQMRYMTTMAPVRPALERFHPEKGDAVPEAFNRHASTHAVGDVQYTRTNSLVGVLLAVSIVREFQAQYAVQAEDGPHGEECGSTRAP
ncbi:hypothetical protein OHA01_08265 [Micromonospora zamorensis]|uniref:hypothetical protein n=1 Tax=Micromonospora zamorensis TaxID=709883 RepID=UPI00386E6CB1|nr:hypothetical protein OHA01_08265 [Micromonospora zamorensis]